MLTAILSHMPSCPTANYREGTIIGEQVFIPIYDKLLLK